MTVLSFADRRTRLGSLVLDVLVSEEVDLVAEVTRYPVEDGTIISDHITQGVETVRISGMVSTASVMAFSFAGGGALKLVDAVDMLRSMHKARALVTISTGQMIYTDMGFTNLNAIRSNDERGGNWLQVRGELVKVRKARLRTAEVPEAPAQAPARGRAGETNKPAGKSSGTSSQAAPTEGQPVNQTFARGAYNSQSGQALLKALKGDFTGFLGPTRP
ncbi:phage baseplate protein [Teichococcus aestuarii]|uniref:Dit-like phage tail protein N-terminal domain-containing protein n=1 Tax=Teichococcus aestuarii TaxID=568898 RepID=A0A2U1UZ74_9PROT|nr:hypothetical protein [Pseudoroseomonas aestuarii]PWC26955.1 hypothetical protein CR165_20515 [Pseudoroseomonas aestuarii]